MAGSVTDSSPATRHHLPAWWAWTPVGFALLVAALFGVVQWVFQVNEFDVSRLGRAANVSKAAFDAARTNWATAIFLATVVMVVLAGSACWSIWRSALSRKSKVALACLALAVVVGVLALPATVVPPMHDRQMQVVYSASGFDPKPLLVAFLAGVFCTTLLVVVGLSIRLSEVADYPTSIERLVTARGFVRYMLGLTTVWLVIGVVGIGLLHRMTRACVTPASVADLDIVAAASTVFAGAFYSALIAGTFAPPELFLRHLAISVAVSSQGISPVETEKWLGEHGFDLSVPKSLMRVVAVLGPLIAGIVQNLAKID